MRLFASNPPRARSKFWYFMSKLRRVKRANGQLISVTEVFEKNPRIVKNYGIWIRYDSRSGTHNMYKEYRGVRLTEAVEQMYNELASRHRVRKSCIQIIKTAIISAKEAKKTRTTQFLSDSIRFPQPNDCIPRPSSRRFRTTFSAVRPTHSAF